MLLGVAGGPPPEFDRAGIASALQHLLLSHTDVNQLGALAELAAAERLVLTHLVPADPKLMSDGQWRKNAQRGYSGRVFVGDDLMTLPLKTKRRRVFA